MVQPDYMDTYKQFLAAKHLEEVLLSKYAQESSRGPLVLYGDTQVEEALENLTERLGYRLLRVVPEISPIGEPAVQIGNEHKPTGKPDAVWRKFRNGNNFLDVKNRELFQTSTEIELYAAPAAAE